MATNLPDGNYPFVMLYGCNLCGHQQHFHTIGEVDKGEPTLTTPPEAQSWCAPHVAPVLLRVVLIRIPLT